MPFSSITFIFVFLPVLLLFFYVIPKRGWKNLVIVLASLAFFGWSDPTHLHVLLLSVVANYLIGLAVGKAIDKESSKLAKVYMWIGVGINLLLLAFYKYTGFFLTSFQAVFPINVAYQSQALPLGISFFTFSGISYILDIYNEVNPPEKNFVRFSAYIVMFPKLLQGPITRFIQIKDSLINPKFDSVLMMEGVRRFIGGLAKKVLLADSLNMATTKIFEANFNDMGAGLAWFGLIAYTLQIYLDFSGYTDMAIGIGNMLGFKLPENFNFPYISKSISDFWRRWHMTLGAWFRTYLFIPLEFARKKQKVLRQESNLIIVFLLTGLWHGANWNFVIWGLFFGVILALEASFLGKRLKKAPVFLQHFYSIALIMLGWIFFRITNIQNWGPFFTALSGLNGWTSSITFRSLNILFYIPFILPAVLFSLPIFHKLGEKTRENGGIKSLVLDIIYLGLFLFTLTYILSKGFTSFMYAQF
jgi:alginate O-acetyltransferase complex protein AlgI